MAVNNKYLFSDITDKTRGAAHKVELGPGLVEKLYQRALKIELDHNGVKCQREKRINMQYNNINIGFDKVDFDVEDKVLVEIKAVSSLNEIHVAQMISYLKSSNRKVGLLINFATPKTELKRLVV